MPRCALLAATLLAGAALAAPGAARAAEESAAFNVSFGGIRAGVLAYRAETGGGQYTAHGSARASGLLGALFEAEIDTVAEGTVSGNTYRPRIAREVTVGPDDQSERTYRYSSAGVPRITRDPERRGSSHDARPENQAGTVDTTTAAFAILRDRPPELACALDITIFDGRRRHRIELDRPTLTPEGVSCAGRYTRLDGFSPDDMSGQTVWPLQMEYARRADGTLQVDQLTFATSFGRARVARR